MGSPRPLPSADSPALTERTTLGHERRFLKGNQRVRSSHTSGRTCCNCENSPSGPSADSAGRERDTMPNLKRDAINPHG
jgi:hypothetical protein